MHISLILDGNRRWAKSKGLPKFVGHKKGIDNLEDILEVCADDPEISYVTVFALSTENMKRDKKELDNLFKLIEKFASKWEKFVKHGVCTKPIGDFSVLPKSTQDALENLRIKTADCKKLIFAPAIHFGGRDEIVRAVNKLLADKVGEVDEKIFEAVLDTKDFPPIDLLIRTGGKKRLSNFLLWECAYAELFFSDKMWPEFSKEDLYGAIDFFRSTQRNFGK